MSYDFDTVKVQGGYNPAQHNNAVSVPIYQTKDNEKGAAFYRHLGAIPLNDRLTFRRAKN